MALSPKEQLWKRRMAKEMGYSLPEIPENMPIEEYDRRVNAIRRDPQALPAEEYKELTDHWTENWKNQQNPKRKSIERHEKRVQKEKKQAFMEAQDGLKGLSQEELEGFLTDKKRDKKQAKDWKTQHVANKSADMRTIIRQATHANDESEALKELTEKYGKELLSPLEEFSEKMGRSLLDHPALRKTGVGVAGLLAAKALNNNFKETNPLNSLPADVLVGYGLYRGAEYGLSLMAEGTEQLTQRKLQSQVLGKSLQEAGKNLEEIAAEVFAERAIKEGQRSFRTGKKAIGAAGLFIAGTSLLQGALDVHYKHETKREVKRRNKEEKEKMEQAAKDRKEQHYGRSFFQPDVDLGELAFDLFDNRTGHHRMGNARF